MKKALLILALSLICIGVNAQSPDWMNANELVFDNQFNSVLSNQKVRAFTSTRAISLSTSSTNQIHCFTNN